MVRGLARGKIGGEEGLRLERGLGVHDGKSAGSIHIGNGLGQLALGNGVKDGCVLFDLGFSLAWPLRFSLVGRC
jgi:hypothetical protein